MSDERELRSRWAVRGALLLVALAALWWVARWFSDEAQIRRSFGAAAKAVASKKILAVASRISRHYSDPYGFSYESFLGLTADTFSSYGDLRLPHSVESVSVSGATASVELSFRLYGRPEGAAGKDRILLGETLNPARARILMRKEHGDWLIEEVQRLEIPNVSPPGGAEKSR